ncbi:MAG: glycerate kinase, partial [Actinomycetes bacterium]
LPGAGAAGGTAACATALLGARIVAGVDVVLDLVGFADAIHGARLVVTGEGSLDAQSLAGKAPVGVARAARGKGVPVLFLAGRVELDEAGVAVLTGLGSVGIRALTELEPEPSVAQKRAGELLRTLAADALEPLLADICDVRPDLVRSTP